MYNIMIIVYIQKRCCYYDPYRQWTLLVITQNNDFISIKPYLVKIMGRG